MPEIIIPAHGWRPRSYQMPLWQYLEGGGKRAVVVAHRRFGKDEVAMQFTAWAALQKPAVWWHLLPKERQARRAIWDAVNPHTGRRRIDEVFPDEICQSKNATTMTITLINGSVWQLVGSDNYDRLVGSPPYGVVLSEWALAKPMAWDYLRPILRENGGIALFLFTPRGRNHGFKIYDMARQSDDWFCEVRSWRDTDVFTQADIDAERAEGMDEAVIESDYECSFDAPIQGAYYAEQLRTARDEGRIGDFTPEAAAQVHTAWDLGVGDATAIWFFQMLGREVRFVDYYENSGHGVEHYAEVLSDKAQDRGWQYGDHWAPHDIRVREWGTKKSRAETALAHGINFRVVPKLGLEDGIQAVRSLFSRFTFDAEQCERGLDALHSYRKEWDEDRYCWKDRPEHDWASDGADSMRYAAVAVREKIEQKRPADLNEELQFGRVLDGVHKRSQQRLSGRARI